MRKSTIGGKKLVIQLGREETLFALWDKGPSFLHTFSLPTPEGAVEDGEILNISAVRDLLNSALAMPELQKVHNVVFALCTSQVISETISTPEMPRKKLDKLIHANIDMYFPVDMTDYRLVWQVIGSKISNTGLKEQRVQLWAVPNAMLVPYYAIANECGLSVAAIDYCGNSIATAVGASFAETTKKSRPKINLNMEISLGRKKSAAVVEEVPAEETVAFTTDLHLTLDKDLIGITFVQNNIVTHQRFIRSGSNPAYQFDEVAMMVEYFRSLDMGRSSELNAMVSGQLADDTYLVDELSFALDMPLTKFTPDYDSCWVVCAGAAQTSLDFGNAELNNPIKNANPKVGQVAQTAVLTAGAAALAGVVALTFVARLSWDSTLNSLEARRQTLTLQLQKVAGFADKYNEYATLYDNYSHDWNTIIGNLRTYNDNLVRVLEELEDIMPRKTSVTALTINADGLEVQFACDNKEDAAYLIMALRELQYANLNNITSLTGGGRGAATSYGNGEKAPTEGSDWLTDDQRISLANMIANDFNTYNVVCEFIEKREYINGMESNFGAMPSTDIVLNLDGAEARFPCKTINELNNIYTGTLTTDNKISLEMRQAALSAMLGTNPFAGVMFVNGMLDEGNEGFFYWDMALEYNSLKYDTPANVKKAIAKVIEIVIQDEEYVTEAENLICKNAKLQHWYVYYLQEQISILLGYDITPEEAAENALPSPVYLNMEAIINDLVADGAFSTSDRKLNSALYGLLSDATLDTVETFVAAKPTPTPPTEATPTPPTEVTPTPPTEVSPTPPTEVTPTPSSKPSQSIDEQVKQYIKEGDCGDPDTNKKLGDYIAKGTTGNIMYNTLISQYLNSTNYDETTKEVVADYMNGTALKNKDLEAAMDLFMEKGTCGNKTVDALLTRAMDLYAKDTWRDYASFKKLMDTYHASKGISSGDMKLNALLARQKVAKSTGSEYLDNMIATHAAEKKALMTGNQQQVQNAVNNATNNNGSTNNKPTDTRVSFTVSLGYNEQLKRAELERRGFNTDNMIEKQEVG